MGIYLNIFRIIYPKLLLDDKRYAREVSYKSVSKILTTGGLLLDMFWIASSALFNLNEFWHYIKIIILYGRSDSSAASRPHVGYHSNQDKTKTCKR